MAHNCHGKNKIPHGKTENLAAKTKYLASKPKPSRQNHVTSRQNQILHSKNQIPFSKSKYPRQKQGYFVFAVKYFVFLLWGFRVCREPWGFWFCREVFCFCREVFGFAVTVVGHPSGLIHPAVNCCCPNLTAHTEFQDSSGLISWNSVPEHYTIGTSAWFMYRSNRSFNMPPPWQPPGHLTFLKIIVQIPP